MNPATVCIAIFTITTGSYNPHHVPQVSHPKIFQLTHRLYKQDLR